jgi:hypothetical protein
MAIQDEIDKGVLFALESLNPDLDSLYEETHQLNMDEYIEPADKGGRFGGWNSCYSWYAPCWHGG